MFRHAETSRNKLLIRQVLLFIFEDITSALLRFKNFVIHMALGYSLTNKAMGHTVRLLCTCWSGLDKHRFINSYI